MSAGATADSISPYLYRRRSCPKPFQYRDLKVMIDHALLTYRSQYAKLHHRRSPKRVIYSAYPLDPQYSLAALQILESDHSSKACWVSVMDSSAIECSSLLHESGEKRPAKCAWSGILCQGLTSLIHTLNIGTATPPCPSGFLSLSLRNLVEFTCTVELATTTT